MNARQPPEFERRRTISPRWVSLCLLANIGLLGGCQHVPAGGAKDVRVSFGIPSVFQVTKTMTGVDVTEDRIKADNSSTTVNILLFSWASSASDVDLPNPKKKGGQP